MRFEILYLCAAALEAIHEFCCAVLIYSTNHSNLSVVLADLQKHSQPLNPSPQGESGAIGHLANEVPMCCPLAETFTKRMTAWRGRFTDAMNILLLLEKLDPGFQEHMRRAIPRVLWAITNLQGWCRGIESRKQSAGAKGQEHSGLC